MIGVGAREIRGERASRSLEIRLHRPLIRRFDEGFPTADAPSDNARDEGRAFDPQDAFAGFGDLVAVLGQETVELLTEAAIGILARICPQAVM